MRRTSWRGRQSEGIRALTLVEVLVVVIVVTPLAFILVPQAAQSTAKQNRIHCASNLKQIGIALRIFATDHADRFPPAVSTNDGGSREWAGAVFRHYLSVSNELVKPNVLACPADRERKSAKDWSLLSDQNLTYFVGLDADDGHPQSLTAGDRNLTIGGVPVNPGIAGLTSNTVVGYTADIHKDCGNVGLADGSMRMSSPAYLRDHLSQMPGTNRLAIP